MLAGIGGQICALPVEGDDDGFQIQLLKKQIGGGSVMLFLANRQAGGALGFGAIELECGRAGVFAEVGDVGGIDDDGDFS